MQSPLNVKEEIMLENWSTRNFLVIRCGGIVTKLYSILTMKNQNTTKQPDFYHAWKFLKYYQEGTSEKNVHL